jgi:hypothetical protein
MFNFFRKRTSAFRISDIIWMREENKWQGCMDLLQKDPSVLFICWFDATQEAFENFLQEKNNVPAAIINARQATAQQLVGKKVVFIEHYPIRNKEQQLFEELHLTEVRIYSALEEPLFRQFGSDKIIQVMKQMGMKETSSIENNMISKAIGNAQDKIENKVTVDQAAHSQADWIQKNYSLQA